jgi:hypothetical protein
MKFPICVLTKDEAYNEMLNICNSIYIARNISMNGFEALSALGSLDELFRTIEYTGDIEKKYELLNDCALEVASYD